MCDDFTAKAEEAALHRLDLSRREFTTMSAAALAVATAPGWAMANDAALSERMVTVTTADGTADAFFVHPASGAHPGVVMWPDIAGLRDAYKAMGRRLAAAGYAVLVVNHYYRSAPAPILSGLTEWRTDAGRAKLAPMIEALSPEGTTRDAKAFVAFLDSQEAVDKSRRIGSNGYCMGGPYTVRTAAAVPERVGAAASFHGARLVTDAPDSPHRLLGQTQAHFLFAIAQNDDAQAPDHKTILAEAAKQAGRPAEVEVYAANHGWCTIDAPVYDEAEANRAWDRMLAMFSTAL